MKCRYDIHDTVIGVKYGFLYFRLSTLSLMDISILDVDRQRL